MALATFMIDHDPRSYALIARSFDGLPEGLTPDDILDNVMHYWLTNTGVCSGCLYWEYKGSYFEVKNVSIPVAVSFLPDEVKNTINSKKLNIAPAAKANSNKSAVNINKSRSNRFIVLVIGIAILITGIIISTYCTYLIVNDRSSLWMKI